MSDILTHSEPCPVVSELKEAIRGGLPALSQLADRWERELREVEPPRALEGVQDLKQWAPHRWGFVYFLCRGDEVLYVGQTVNPIKHRLHYHRTRQPDPIPFTSVWYTRVAVEEIDAEERLWIRRLRPPFNLKGLDS